MFIRFPGAAAPTWDLSPCTVSLVIHPDRVTLAVSLRAIAHFMFDDVGSDANDWSSTTWWSRALDGRLLLGNMEVAVAAGDEAVVLRKGERLNLAAPSRALAFPAEPGRTSFWLQIGDADYPTSDHRLLFTPSSDGTFDLAWSGAIAGDFGILRPRFDVELTGQCWSNVVVATEVPGRLAAVDKAALLRQWFDGVEEFALDDLVRSGPLPPGRAPRLPPGPLSPEKSPPAPAAASDASSEVVRIADYRSIARDDQLLRPRIEVAGVPLMLMRRIDGITELEEQVLIRGESDRARTRGKYRALNDATVEAAGIVHSGGEAVFAVRGLAPGRDVLLVARWLRRADVPPLEIKVNGRVVRRYPAIPREMKRPWLNATYVVPGELVTPHVEIAYVPIDEELGHYTHWVYQVDRDVRLPEVVDALA